MNESGTRDPGAQMELLASSPRPVRLTGAGVFVAALAVILFAAGVFCAAWLPGVASRQAERRARFAREAAIAEAEILAIGPRRGKNSRRTVTYRFSAGGQVFTARRTLDRREWRGLEPGARVPVRYLPSDPPVSYLGSGPDAFPVWAVPIVALPLAFGGLGLGWSIRRQLNLLSEGRPALARVTGSKRSHHGKHRVQYEFRNLSGALVHGSYEAGKPAPPGATLVVLYDRDNPRRAARYPLPLARLARH